MKRRKQRFRGSSAVIEESFSIRDLQDDNLIAHSNSVDHLCASICGIWG